MSQRNKALCDNNEGFIFRVQAGGDYQKILKMIEDNQVPQTLMNCLGAVFGTPKSNVFWIQVDYAEQYENWEIEAALEELGIVGMQMEDRSMEVIFDQEGLS